MTRETLGLILASLLVGSSAQAADHRITIDNFIFTPKALTIHVGDTVTWKNQDDIPHTVTEKTSTFTSPALDTDEEFQYTFTSAGEVSYFCALHPHMTATIIVAP